MKKYILIPILILIVIISFGSLYYFKIYMSERNILNRYLESKSYSCIENICTKKNKDDKYTFDTKDKTMYISNNKYILTIGDNNPSLKLKNGKETCNYELNDNEKHITLDISLDNKCKQYVEEINKYIDVYNKILKDNNI